jgi:phosphoserine aminotransferase
VDDTRKLLDVPDNFEIIYMPAGGSNQMSAVCYNLLKDGKEANYVVSGFWSNKAVLEAEKYCRPNYVINCPPSGQACIPDESTWKVDRDASYTYFCDNETTQGAEFIEFPFHLFEGQVMVADMSSTLGYKKIDWSKMGVVFASSSKNFGPSGCCPTIIRRDLFGQCRKDAPFMCDWTKFKDQYLHTTPAILPIYMCGLNVEHMLNKGGVEYYENLAVERSTLFYRFIDSSNGFYRNHVPEKFRSRMNI